MFLLLYLIVMFVVGTKVYRNYNFYDIKIAVEELDCLQKEIERSKGYFFLICLLSIVILFLLRDYYALIVYPFELKDSRRFGIEFSIMNAIVVVPLVYFGAMQFLLGKSKYKQFLALELQGKNIINICFCSHVGLIVFLFIVVLEASNYPLKLHRHLVLFLWVCSCFFVFKYRKPVED